MNIQSKATEIKGYSVEDREELGRQLGKDLSKQDSEALAAAIAGRQLADPSPNANDWIWKAIIGSFAGVLVLTATSLVSGLIWKLNGSVAAELILSLFTSVAGFLAGLISPSPFRKPAAE